MGLFHPWFYCLGCAAKCTAASLPPPCLASPRPCLVAISCNESHCYICNMPHRSTLYRRRTGTGRCALPRAKRNCRQLGGRHEMAWAREEFLLVLVAALIADRRASIGVDYEMVRQEICERRKRPEVRAIFERIRGWSYPASLVAIACAEALRLGVRTRNEDGAGIATRLKAEYPALTKKEIAAFMRQPNAAWLQVAAGGSPKPLAFSSTGNECPSRIFPISRRMVSYWRRHDDYQLAVASIGSIAHKGNTSSATPFMRPPSRSKRRSTHAPGRYETTLFHPVHRQARGNLS